MVSVFINCGANNISDCTRILTWMKRNYKEVPILDVRRTVPSRNPENMKIPERVEIGTPDFVVQVSGNTNLTIEQIKSKFQSQLKSITTTPNIEVY